MVSIASLLFVQPRCKSLIIHDAISPLDMHNSSKVPLTTFFQPFDVPAITCFCFTAIKLRWKSLHYLKCGACSLISVVQVPGLVLQSVIGGKYPLNPG